METLFGSYVPTSEVEARDLILVEFPKCLFLREKAWWIKLLTKLPFLKQLDESTQTMPNRIYLHPDWDSFSRGRKIATLMHEREHLRQFKKYSLPLMALLYICVFFPIGLSYFRWKFEREAMKWDIRSRITIYGHSKELKSSLRRHYLRMACSYFYVWAFPFEDYIIESFDRDYRSILEEI